MAAPVPVRIRQEVAERAAYRCEYCGLPQLFALHAHEPDHIVSRQHGGESHLQNLA
jgi:5-methylcytosine-specific restriction endonuclease McrA